MAESEAGPEPGGTPRGIRLRSEICTRAMVREMSRKGCYLSRTVLGKGGYAIVYVAERKDQPVACKVVDVEKMVRNTGETERFAAARELEISKMLNHENVIKTFETFEHLEGHLLSTTFIFMELCENDLISIVKKKGGLSEDETRKIFRGVCRGLEYMHSHPQKIYHGDIKPDNILIARGVAKLCDFTMSRSLKTSPELRRPGQKRETKTIMDVCGTDAYMSPEMLTAMSSLELGRRPVPFDPLATDVYSLAITLYVTLENCNPFYNSKWCTWYGYSWVIDRQRKQHFTFKRPISAAGLKLLRAMTQFHPDSRPKMNVVVEDEWFRSLSSSDSSSGGSDSDEWTSASD